MTIAFTGTQQGMTAKQLASVVELFYDLGNQALRHGDCIGSDEQAHWLHRAAWPQAMIHIHPGDNINKCAFVALRDNGPLTRYKAMDNLRRNHHMVDRSGIVVGAPKETQEVLRSGTWATLRYAQKKGKKLYVVLPNGAIVERWSKRGR